MADELEEEAKKQMKYVYDRGINIYMYINKTKKQLKRVENFPSEVIIEVSKEFIHRLNTGKINNNYTYFLKLLKMKSADYYAKKSQAESPSPEEKRSRHVPQTIKDIMKGA